MSVAFEPGRISHLGTLTIANGAAASGVMLAKVYQGFSRLAIVGPAALTATCAVEVLDLWTNDETDDANWRDYQEVPGTDVDVAADKAITILPPMAPAFRIKDQAGNELAERLFQVYGIR